VPTPDLEQTLSELRRLARVARRRPTRIGEAAPLLARVLASGRTVGVEQRAGGIAFRLEVRESSGAGCRLTCVIHEADPGVALTTSEREVAGQLCDGRTLAQIASLRGVTINTVKSQVRQIFRKLEVDTRVGLVRRLCP
jgi:DNA-binding CsgD family transcriptional regulator